MAKVIKLQTITLEQRELVQKVEKAIREERQILKNLRDKLTELDDESATDFANEVYTLLVVRRCCLLMKVAKHLNYMGTVRLYEHLISMFD